MNSRFSFSETSCLIKVKGVLILTHNWKENYWSHTFLKGISAMLKADSLGQDMNWDCLVHHTGYQVQGSQYREFGWYLSAAICFMIAWTNIYIISCRDRQHGYPRPSLATSPYRSLHGRFRACIPYPHKLLYVCSSRSSCFCSAICGGP